MLESDWAVGLPPPTHRKPVMEPSSETLEQTFERLAPLVNAAAEQAGEAEVDRVIDPGSLKAGDRVRVAQDLLGEIRPIRAAGAVVQVITEASLLAEAEKVAACLLWVGPGADFVRTPTGIGADGATTENVALMRRLVGPSLGVKAAGEIRTWPTPGPCWPQVRPARAPASASPSFRKPLVAASLPKANGG